MNLFEFPEEEMKDRSAEYLDDEKNNGNEINVAARVQDLVHKQIYLLPVHFLQVSNIISELF